MAHPGAAGGAPPMAGIPPPMIYQNMNYPLPPNHPTWGHNIRHPRECQSSYHVPSRPMPSMNALHEEWQEYYLDRKAMIIAAGKTIEYVVGPDRNNGAPHGRQVRSYVSLGDILDQPRPVAAHGGHAAIHCFVPDQWGHMLSLPQDRFDTLMLRYLLPIYLSDERKTPGAQKLRSGINIETGAGGQGTGRAVSERKVKRAR